jgi:hypothetical protein
MHYQTNLHLRKTSKHFSVNICFLSRGLLSCVPRKKIKAQHYVDYPKIFVMSITLSALNFRDVRIFKMASPLRGI